MKDVKIIIEHNGYRVGKRVKNMNPHKFIVSEKVYETLQKYKYQDIYQYAFGVYKTVPLMEELSNICISFQEQEFYYDLKHKLLYEDKIIVKRDYNKKTLIKTVEKICQDKAYFKNKKGNLFGVKLSDRVKYEGIKEKDEALIIITLTDEWLVSEITHHYDEQEEKEQLQKELEELDSLFGK